jgi:hypothetical protein
MSHCPCPSCRLAEVARLQARSRWCYRWGVRIAGTGALMWLAIVFWLMTQK